MYKGDCVVILKTSQTQIHARTKTEKFILKYILKIASFFRCNLEMIHKERIRCQQNHHS